ncbi:F-box/FBD/LRR-repeat protein [Trifolium pratense]|uniref:F-box/FBD/LRR-repeat protein n=1 Tax=Trifolium pratense TaxID=57577 RepID=A0A2K3LJU3_TRIPR|nr:F-box/FBD/LRR-repeat protein [Trifolium pratense]
MSQFNKKAHQYDQIDRISDLPSNVIDGILEHLDIRDVVRTSILSTKWRYMWTSVPTLWFDEFFDEYEHDEFFYEYEHLVDCSPVVSKIITDVLMRHNGTIYHFSLFIPPEYNFKITMEHFDTWVPLLSRKGIKYLELANHGTHLDQMPYIVLSCKELTYFKFAGFNLSIPPNFSGFKRLLKLHFISVTFESRALESLISGCPLLEKLNIEYCNGFEYFDFSAPSLKILSLNFDENVESICLKKAKNLIDLTLIAAEGWVSGLIKSLPKNLQRFSIGSNYNNEVRKQHHY